MKRTELNDVAKLIRQYGNMPMDDLRVNASNSRSKTDARMATYGQSRADLIANIVYEEMDCRVSPSEEDVG